MQLKDLLDGFMRIQRRSEKAAPEILRKTFVDVGPLTTLLSITDNQTLFGRRGTGKTHVLQFLGSKQRENGDLSVYIDLSNLGSSVLFIQILQEVFQNELRDFLSIPC